MDIPDPRGMDALYWAATLKTNITSDVLPSLHAPDDWQPWAAAVVQSPVFAGALAPWPYQYRDWDEWAMALWLATGGAIYVA